jgi:signal transduction histidine kinase
LLRCGAEAFEPLAAEKQIRLSVDGDGEVRVVVSSHLLDRVVANLLDNGFRHSQARGTGQRQLGGQGGAFIRWQGARAVARHALLYPRNSPDR